MKPSKRSLGARQSDPCLWPDRPASVSPPRFADLPERVIGCRYAAHGNSTARSDETPARTALSMHPGPRAQHVLFNVHAPVIFDQAVLHVNQTAAKRAARQQLQKVVWPGPKPCMTATDCLPRDREGKPVGEVRAVRSWDEKAQRWAQSDTPVCKVPTKRRTKPGAKPGACFTVRRTKAPMGYVDGHVYPDDGDRRATNIAFFPGDCRDWDAQGQCLAWVEAKYVDTQCPDFRGNPAACPAVGVRDPATPPGASWTRFGRAVVDGQLVPFSSVRFVPNAVDPRANEDGSPLPFSVTLEGRRRRVLRRRKG